jgi:hypothetical protein
MSEIRKHVSLGLIALLSAMILHPTLLERSASLISRTLWP